MATTLPVRCAAGAILDARNAHGYNYRPTCACGWIGPWRYLTRDAALAVAVDHPKGA